MEKELRQRRRYMKCLYLVCSRTDQKKMDIIFSRINRELMFLENGYPLSSDIAQWLDEVEKNILSMDYLKKEYLSQNVAQQ